MKLFGEELNKEDILKKIGDITQLGGIKCYEFSDGLSRGLRAVDIKSPCGLDMTVLLDRGMDISNLSYKSIPISWRSVTRETSPSFFESRGNEFNRTFFGGLLTTCGLTYIGHPCIDEGEKLGLHGRISNLSAENVWADGKWEKDTYIMWVKGRVREAKVFGNKLQLERKISTCMDIPRVVIEDTVKNIGSEESPIAMLYHINIGYPILGNSSILLEGKAKVYPRDKEAEEGIKDYYRFSEPIPKFKERVYFHDIEADSYGNSNIAIVNKDFNNGQGIGIWLKFNKENLPCLVQWKQMGIGEYVCGIEPANSLPGNRKKQRENGTLKFLQQGEKVKYRLEFNILASNKDIEIFKDKYCS